MLEAEVSDVIAERIEEVVIAIVMRAEKLLGLLDEALVMVPGFLRGVESGGAVGGDVHFGDRVGGERDDLQKLSGDDGRVDERGERDGRELNFVGALAGDRKRRAKFPAVGQFEAGGVVDVVRPVAGGVEQDLVPTDDGQFVGGRGTSGESAFEGCGREEIEFGGDFSYASGDFDVESEAVEQIAAPFERLTSRAELQSGKIDDRAVGSVLAGDPLRVVEGEVAGSGGALQRSMENLARCGGGVDRN